MDDEKNLPGEQSRLEARATKGTRGQWKGRRATAFSIP